MCRYILCIYVNLRDSIMEIEKISSSNVVTNQYAYSNNNASKLSESTLSKLKSLGIDVNSVSSESEAKKKIEEKVGE